jgi:hypothetical protein
LGGDAPLIRGFALSLVIQTNKDADLFQHFLKNVVWNRANEDGVSLFPVQTFNVVGKNNPGHAVPRGDRDLEKKAFTLVGDRTDDRQADFAVVLGRRDDEGRAAPCLFVTSFWRKIEPNGVAPLGGITRHPHPPLNDFLADRRAGIGFGVQLVRGYVR